MVKGDSTFCESKTKQKILIRIFDLILSLDSCFARIAIEVMAVWLS